MDNTYIGVGSANDSPTQFYGHVNLVATHQITWK